MILLAALMLQNAVFAQGGGDDNIGTDSLKIITKFKPILTDPVKLSFPPRMPDIEKDLRLLKYTTPVSLLGVAYEGTPLKPLAIQKEKPNNYPTSYFKLGFGTQLSPLAELMFNDGSIKKAEKYGKFHKYSYGVYFKHHSARATKLDNQDFNDNEAKVYGEYLFNKSKIKSEAYYKRDAVWYYGYNHEDTAFRKKDVKQRFNDVGWKANMTNIVNGKAAFNYDAQVGLSHFGDINDINEFDINFKLFLQKVIKERHFASLEFYEDYNTHSNPFTADTNRNIFWVKPKYKYLDDNWQVYASASLVWEGDIFHVLPDVSFQRSLFKEYIIMFNGWRMTLRKNSFQSLTDKNPYLGPRFGLRNTRFEERNIIGLKGTVKNFTYNLRFGQQVARHLPLFVTDTADTKVFTINYDKRVDILFGHIELIYRVSSKLDFTLLFDYNSFEADENAKAWHMPRIFANFNARYKIGEKIYITADVFGVDGVFAPLPEGGMTQLNSTVDVSLGATYKFSKYFTFFANLNNLASIKHEVYYQYPTYGFNGMVGAIFTY